MKLYIHWAVSVLLFITFGSSSIVNAALIPTLGGLGIYDSDQDITWLADHNYAYSRSRWMK